MSTANTTRGRAGWLTYAAILHSLQIETMTPAALSKRHQVTGGNMSQILRRMLALQLVHIAGWQGATPQSQSPLFAWGAGVNAPKPPGGMPSYAPLRPNAELITAATILRELQHTAHSAETLAAATGVWPNRAATFLRGARAAGFVYIAGWIPRCRALPGGKPIALHRLREPGQPATEAETFNALQFKRINRRGDPATPPLPSSSRAYAHTNHLVVRPS